MKEKKNIKRINALLPVIGLVLLLLLSPCKVRNYIQAELGIPQTEVTNKVKTTIGNPSCNTFETNNNALTSSKPVFLHVFDLPANDFSIAFNAVGFANKSNNPYKTRNHVVSFVPFYILYQSLKVYL